MCFHRRAARADLCWHAARVETLDLIQHDEVVRRRSRTGLPTQGGFDGDGGTKTIMSNDVCLGGSSGSLLLLNETRGRGACPRIAGSSHTSRRQTKQKD